MPKENQTNSVIENAHSLVHEISHSIENGNTEDAKEKLLTLDMLLHNHN